MNVPRSRFHQVSAFSLWGVLAISFLVSQQQITICYGAGTVLAWGANDSLQLVAPPMNNVVAVAGGDAHSLALLSDGTVRAWGNNLSGQTSVPANLTATRIAGGSTYSLALRTDGTVALWGSMTPPPAGLSNVIAIAAGWSHCLALRSDQTVVSWGSQTTVPADLNNVVAIAAGTGNSLALKADGTVVAWGDNTSGKTNVPAGLANVIAIAAGANHCLALQRGGTVVAWGLNTSGQATVPANLNAVGIAAGALHSIALKTDGSLAAWGNNSYGQTVVNPSDTGFIAVAAGGYHGLAIRGDGSPFILSQPASQYALISKSASFQVIATGTAPLRYQWQLYGTNVAGATTSTLSIGYVQPTNAGPYTVTVANDFGSVTSAVAVLTAVGGAPVLVTALTNQTVICGDSTVLQASFGGSSPFTYQWQFKGTLIRNATQTSLTLTNVSQAQAGQYSITANNPYGSVTSSAELTVDVQPPAITSSLTASGTQGVPFTYRIMGLHNPTNFNAIYLPAALVVNTNTGVISGIPEQSGTFGVQITAANACTSDTETLVLTIAAALPTITSPTTAAGTEGQPFTYQITATASPVLFGAINLPVGLYVDPQTGFISGTPTYAGTFDSIIWASNNWGKVSANLEFTFANANISNINIGNVTYNYSSPYLLDFQFSLFTVLGPDPMDTNAPISGVVVDPKLLSAICLEDGVTNSPTETGSFIVEGNTKVVKVYLVLDFTLSIASLLNGDTNGNGISDAVDFMVAGAQDFVNQQPFDTQIGVIEFHSDTMAPSNVVALTTDKVLLNQSIAGIYTNYVRGSSSGSRCWDAVQAAITAVGTSNRDEQHFVVFVSDGRDESSTATLSNVIASATSAAVKVFALGFGGELDPVPLQTLTSQTSGRYFNAGNDPAALATQFAEITKSAKGQYILRWATLKRGSTPFMPSFIIKYGDLLATSPTNTVTEEVVPDPNDTNTPPANITNYLTNVVIAAYVPSSNAGPTEVGTLRVVPNKEVLPTALDLRATYVPREITQLRIHYRPNWPCTPQIQNTGAGELLSGWSLVQTNDGAGGFWMQISSPNVTNPLTSIPFPAFGKLVTFAFNDVINPSNSFSFFDIDNTVYTNIGVFVHPSFRIENTNDFIKSFPVLPYGTPVPWLMSYGFSGNFTNAEVADTDLDGMLNWQEYRANTNPTNALSKFVIRSASRLVDGRWQVTFSTSINRTYRVDASTDLATWQTVQDNIPGINQDVTIIDTRYVPSSSMYYRVMVY